MINCAGYGDRDFGNWLVDHTELGMARARDAITLLSVNGPETQGIGHLRACYVEFHRIRALAFGNLIGWSIDQALEELDGANPDA